MIINILVIFICVLISYKIGHAFEYADGMFDANINHYNDIKDNT